MVYSKKVNDIIADLILAAMLSLSFTYSLISSLHFSYTPVKILGICSFMLAVFTAVFWNKLLRRITYIAAAVVIIYIFGNGHFFNYVRQGREFFIWLYDYINGDVNNYSLYEMYTVIFLCFVVTLPVFFITVKRFSFYIILVSGISIYASQWIWEFFVSYGAFYLFIISVLISYFKYIYLKKNSVENGDYIGTLQFTVWASVISCIIFVAAMKIPVSSEPIQWEWLDGKVASLSSYVRTQYKNSISKFDYFSIGYTGFGKNDKLGGKVSLDNTAVLEVKGNKPTYLKALGKDTYTGTSWMDTDTDSDAENINNYREILDYNLFEGSIGLQLLAGRNLNYNLNSAFANSTYDIKFLELRTKSLFIPGMAEKIEFLNGQRQISVTGNSTVSMDSVEEKDFSYKVDSVVIDYSDRGFKNFLVKSYKGFYEDILKNRIGSDAFRYNYRRNPIIILGGESRRIRYVDFIYQLARNAEQIQTKYTQIPESLPQRVRDLARDITISKENNYDKVKAIEQYLSTTFPYTITPKSTPRGRDFVDYFLFDLKEGYCTYYASAMALMVRSIGLPARYIEGYMMPYTTQSENTYIVTNENAHAWVEVYFEGFGWVPFEPTAPFTSNFYEDTPQEQVPQDSSTETEPAQPEDAEVQQEDPGTDDSQGLNPTGWVLENSSAISFIGIIVILGALLMILININKGRRKILKIMKMDSKSGILSFYKHFIHLMKLQGYNIEIGETPAQFANRVDKGLLLAPVNFTEVTNIFVIARYSNNSLEDKYKESFYEFHETLVESCKRKMGKVKFYFYRCLLGII